MRDTYKPAFWSVDYASAQEENIDPAESDEALEEYIECRRTEFHKEWDEYLTRAFE